MDIKGGYRVTLEGEETIEGNKAGKDRMEFTDRRKRE